MVTALLALLAALLVGAALYAQRQLATFTRGAGSVLLTRAVLALVGLGFGFVSMRYAQTDVDAALAFVAGFGLVHVPAAIILRLKRARGAGKT